jgi:hypothetical protein
MKGIMAKDLYSKNPFFYCLENKVLNLKIKNTRFAYLLSLGREHSEYHILTAQ